jgi:hypothetical protein
LVFGHAVHSPDAIRTGGARLARVLRRVRREPYAGRRAAAL